MNWWLHFVFGRTGLQLKKFASRTYPDTRASASATAWAFFSMVMM